MGRRRTRSPTWLPKRCYPHRRQIFYFPKEGKPIALGLRTDPAACLEKYAEVVGMSGKRPGTVADGIDKFIVEELPKYAESTHVTYLEYFAKLKWGLGDMRPDEVTIADLYDYHAAREAPVRANREISVLGKVYRFFIKWRCATKNPVLGFLYHEEKERERDVSASERRRFARGYAPKWLHGYLALKYLTGRRQGELLKLGLFSERKAGIAFRILKKRRYREVIVRWSPRLRVVWEWLKKLPRQKNSVMIFPASRGKRRGQALSARGFKSAWRRAQVRWIADGNMAFWEHDIRAATATAAESDERARELLDHGELRVTRKYRRGTAKVRPLR